MKNLITSMILAILMLMGYDPQALVQAKEPRVEQAECSSSMANANASATTKTLESDETEITVEDAYAR